MYCRGLRPDRRGKIEAVKLVSSTSLRGIPKHSKIFQRNVETLRLVPLKSLGWMPKSVKILRSRPQIGDRKKWGKTCRMIWGRCRAGVQALRGWRPVGFFFFWFYSDNERRICMMEAGRQTHPKCPLHFNAVLDGTLAPSAPAHFSPPMVTRFHSRVQRGNLQK